MSPTGVPFFRKFEFFETGTWTQDAAAGRLHGPAPGCAPSRKMEKTMRDGNIREANDLLELNVCITDAQERFAALLESYLRDRSTTIDQYVRYLSFQYHLTRDAQRYFMAIAEHPDLAGRRALGECLFRFANEEELHYLVATNELHKLGMKPLPMPFDVELWHHYFRTVVADRPFVGLGAVTILENISDGVAREWVRKALVGEFLTRDDSRFLVLQPHETRPPGDRILGAIGSGELEPHHCRDLVEGARKGTVLYLRMAEWAIRPQGLASVCDRDGASVEAREEARIESFSTDELWKGAA